MTECTPTLAELEARIATARGRRANYTDEEFAALPPRLQKVHARLPKAAPGRMAGTRQVPHEVYRLYDHAGTLLYVGLSLTLLQRIGQHKQSAWWHRVTRIEIERAPNRDAASQRERELITDLRPLFNRNGGGA